MALADLRTIFTDAAVSPEFQEFAIDVGIRSTSMFARVALTPQEVRERFVQPFIDEIGMKDAKLKATAIEASALSAWDAANLQRTTAAAALPFALPPLSVSRRQCPPPYQESGKTKSPSIHESSATRLFSPVSLGEFLKARAYSSNGLINPLATKRSDEQTLGWKRTADTAELTTTVDRFEPKSARAIIDGLEGVKWSYSWAGYGTDVVADSSSRDHRSWTRSSQLYEASAWELCMLVRSGMGFETAVTDVTGRTSWMREYLEDFKISGVSPSFTRRSQNLYRE